MLSQLASELNTGLMPNPAVSGTYRSNDLPVAAGHLHVPGRSDNLIFVSLVITVKQTHSTHGIYFLSLAEVAGDFFFLFNLVSLLASENRFSWSSQKPQGTYMGQISSKQVYNFLWNYWIGAALGQRKLGMQADWPRKTPNITLKYREVLLQNTFLHRSHGHRIATVLPRSYSISSPPVYSPVFLKQ